MSLVEYLVVASFPVNLKLNFSLCCILVRVECLVEVFQFGQLHVMMFSSYVFLLISVADNMMMERQTVLCAGQA